MEIAHTVFQPLRVFLLRDWWHDSVVTLVSYGTTGQEKRIGVTEEQEEVVEEREGRA